MKYSNRSLWKQIISSPIALVGIFLLLIILGKASWNIQEKNQLAQLKLTQAQMELDKLKTRESDLNEQISRLSTDQGIEAELRTKFRAIKDGELVAVIVDPNAKNLLSKQTKEVGSTTAKVNWFQKVLQIIGL